MQQSQLHRRSSNTKGDESIVEPQHHELPAGFSTTSTNKVDCHVSKRLFALDGDPFLAPKKQRYHEAYRRDSKNGAMLDPTEQSSEPKQIRQSHEK
ncbi:hypothetical protein HYALB_00005523 [Hymenoscyphus albidus]|uniref:Uncharacterized protein n=1 Tax=Hymenoscyphus albidus TaxID=595503 RepID=A0A9N9LZF5_9HELO|nr:hypothetical protein HYALB_00005523 [Hymenoscyphus albidus]